MLVRKMFFLVALVLIAAEAFAMPMIATSGDSTVQTSSYVLGVRHEDKFIATAGAAFPITGGLYSIDYGDFGSGGTLNTELAYFVRLVGGLHLAAIAGPNFQSYGSQDDPLTYFLGAAGGIMTYNFPKWGFWISGKYKFKLDDSSYENQTVFGGGIFVNIFKSP